MNNLGECRLKKKKKVERRLALASVRGGKLPPPRLRGPHVNRGS